MEKPCILFLFIWLGSLPGQAQRTSPPAEIPVSDSSTTYLVFSGPVSLVDVGMAEHYLVKIEGDAVFVRARRKNPVPTPILVRHGSRYWMGRLVYSARPVLQLYDLQGGVAPPEAGSGPLQRSGPPGANGEEIARKLAELRQAREEHQSVAVVGNDLVLSLANVRNDGDFTFLRFKVINRTNIDYRVDFTDFQLVENSSRRFLGKKRNQARRPLPPVGGEAEQTIPGRSTGYLAYALPLYAATGQGYLEVTLRERNGARVLVLPIPSRVINRAKTI
ncbi:DUF4138 domain-containing protein [Sabulibacter ruber]|uniref:DUF4138 domain-containing protein n=1 Tax=Sabulibacter ruber TaxID=2811901 RepID=UPI001A964CA3|nr:DUF4138 domain-containing protein [Sabulibacter ruber]